MATMLEQVVTLLNAGYTRKEIDVLLEGKKEVKEEVKKEPEVKKEVKEEVKEEVKTRQGATSSTVFTDEQIAQIVQAVNKYQAKGTPEEGGAGTKTPEQTFYEKYFGKESK